MTITTLEIPPKKGDKLLIKTNTGQIELLTIDKVAVSEYGTDIAFTTHTGISLETFLSGTSWVKEAFLVS